MSKTTATAASVARTCTHQGACVNRWNPRASPRGTAADYRQTAGAGQRPSALAEPRGARDTCRTAASREETGLLRRLAVSLVVVAVAACAGSLALPERARTGGTAADLDKSLTVTFEAGTGTVTSSPAGIN